MKVHPRTGHEGPEREQRCSSAISLTSVVGRGGWFKATSLPLYPRERYPVIGGWVGPTAGLDGCGKSPPHRDLIPGPPCPQRVAIPTELRRPTLETGETGENFLRSYHSDYETALCVRLLPTLREGSLHFENTEVGGFVINRQTSRCRVLEGHNLHRHCNEHFKISCRGDCPLSAATETEEPCFKDAQDVLSFVSNNLNICRNVYSQLQ